MLVQCSYNVRTMLVQCSFIFHVQDPPSIISKRMGMSRKSRRNVASVPLVYVISLQLHFSVHPSHSSNLSDVLSIVFYL